MSDVFLILSHDLDSAKTWIENCGIENLHIIDEREVVKTNPTRFSLQFLDLNYSKSMVDTMHVLRLAYKSSRPLAIIMDMRHQTAVEKIKHDKSILFYDNSLKYRLAYHPFYKTSMVIDNAEKPLELA